MKENSTHQVAVAPSSADIGERPRMPYIPPQISYSEDLEVAAGTCDGGKTPTGCPAGPWTS